MLPSKFRYLCQFQEEEDFHRQDVIEHILYLLILAQVNFFSSEVAGNKAELE